MECKSSRQSCLSLVQLPRVYVGRRLVYCLIVHKRIVGDRNYSRPVETLRVCTNVRSIAWYMATRISNRKVALIVVGLAVPVCAAWCSCGYYLHNVVIDAANEHERRLADEVNWAEKEALFAFKAKKKEL